MSAARSIAEAALGHPVPYLLAGEDDDPIVAASVTGDLPRARVAWVDRAGAILARVACPPGRPSRWRPLVASVLTLDMAPTIEDRVLVVRAASEASAIVPVLASEEPSEPVEVGAEGLALVRLPMEMPVLAVDALDSGGEPIGRLARSGVAELRFDGSTVSGRLGATHGMARRHRRRTLGPDPGRRGLRGGLRPVAALVDALRAEPRPPAGGAGRLLSGRARRPGARMDRR